MDGSGACLGAKLGRFWWFVSSAFLGCVGCFVVCWAMFLGVLGCYLGNFGHVGPFYILQ